MEKSNKLSCLILLIILLSLALYTKAQESIFESNSNFCLNNIKIYVENGGNVNLKDKNGASILMWAAYNGDIDAVKFLVNKGADPSQKGAIYLDTLGSSYGNLLAIATGEGNLDLLKYFIEELKIDVNDREFNPNDSTESGWTALHWAINSVNEKRIEIIEYLLNQKEIDVNVQDNNGYTPLFNSVFKNDTLSFKLMLSNINIDLNKQSTNDGNTVLHYAVFSELLPFVKMLSNKPSLNINLQNKLGCTALHYCVNNNDTTILDILINDKYINANIQDENGFTLLHYAAYFGKEKIIDFLLKSPKIDVNSKSIDGYTALQIAIIQKYFNICSKLVNNPRININEQTYKGNTALHYAVYSGDIEILNLLLSNINVNVSIRGEKNYTPLNLAIINSFNAAIELLLAHKADIDLVDEDGRSPLINSVVKDNYEITKILLQNNANMYVIDNNSFTALHMAIENKNLKMVELFIANDFDLTFKNEMGITPFHWAVRKGDLNIISKIYYTNKNLAKALDINGSSPLHWAVDYNHYNVVEFLLKNKVSPDVKDDASSILSLFKYQNTDEDFEIFQNETKAGFTPLHYAVFYGYENIVKLLLEYNANINDDENILRIAPIHLAVTQQNFSLIELLVKHKANINLVNCFDYSVLHMAIILNNISLAQKLLDYGADININPQFKDTPLHLAVFLNNLKMVKFLCDQGADVNLKNEDGFTPIHIAFTQNNIEILDILFNSNNFNSEDFEQDLYLNLAVQINNEKLVKKILNLNPNVNLNDNLIGSPIHYAVLYADTNVLNILLPYCEDIDLPNKYGLTALQLAVEQNKISHVKILLDKGASVMSYLKTDQGNKYNYPFEIAVQNNNLSMLRILIGHLDKKTKESIIQETNVLLLAILNNNKEIFKYLINEVESITPANFTYTLLNDNTDLFFLSEIINHDNNFGNKLSPCKTFTPLILAAMFNNFEAVELLLQNNTQIQTKTISEKTVIDTCLSLGLKKMYNYIIGYPNVSKPHNTFKKNLQIINSLPLYDSVNYVNYFITAYNSLNEELEPNSIFYLYKLSDLLYTNFNRNYLNTEYFTDIIDKFGIITNELSNNNKLPETSTYLNQHKIMLGDFYAQINKPDSALKYYHLVYNADEPLFLGDLDFKIGMIYTDMLYNKDSSLFYFTKALYSKETLNPFLNINSKAYIATYESKESYFDEYISFHDDIDFIWAFSPPNSFAPTNPDFVFSKYFSYTYRKSNHDLTNFNALKYVINTKYRGLKKINEYSKFSTESQDLITVENNMRLKELYDLNYKIDLDFKSNTNNEEYYKQKNIINKEINTIINTAWKAKPKENKNVFTDIDIVSELQEKVKDNEVIIDFVNFKLMKYDNINVSTDSIIYAAIIMRPNQNLHFIPLFEEKDLNKIIKKEDGSSDKNYISNLYSNKGEDLYKLIWEPILPYLDSVNNIYLSPTGALFNIAFNAIPISKDSVLGDKYKFRYYMNSSSMLKEETITLENITVFYDIDYNSLDTAINNALPQIDFLAESEKSEISDIYANEKSASQILKPFSHSKYLPDSIFNESKVKDINIKLFDGPNATKRQFLKLSGTKQSIIHFDTHGKYVSSNEKDHYSDSYRIYKHSNPMYRSYLAMAGINDTITVGNEAILTAYEISNIDLSDTELVVLSACETAKGDILGNEGVYGLLRGFKIAGVDYIIASLWSVDASASYEFMKIFYNKLFEAHSTNDRINVNNIFTETQNKMRQNPKYSNPYYWAAYILIK